MLSLEDIEKLSNYLLVVFYNVLMTKEDAKNLEVKMDRLQTSVDGLDKAVRDNSDAILVNHKGFEQVKDFLSETSVKLGLEFKV